MNKAQALATIKEWLDYKRTGDEISIVFSDDHTTAFMYEEGLCHD